MSAERTALLLEIQRLRQVVKTLTTQCAALGLTQLEMEQHRQKYAVTRDERDGARMREVKLRELLRHLRDHLRPE